MTPQHHLIMSKTVRDNKHLNGALSVEVWFYDGLWLCQGYAHSSKAEAVRFFDAIVDLDPPTH